MTPRRALLAAPALLLTRPTRAQITSLDLPPMALATRPDDAPAAGYRRDLMIRWGDRVTFDAGPWDPRAASPDSVAGQFGWDARLAALMAPRMGADGIPRLIAALLHPEVEAAMAFPGGRDRPGVAAALSGASLLNLERQGDRWVLVDGGFQSRRFGLNTLCRIGGPALARLGSGVVGLLAPTGGCATPWGTLLLAEPEPTAWQARLRDLETKNFGWLAEVDPLDPQSVPVKRSALGRIGAVAVAASLAPDGRAVVVLADGQPQGFLYRFVSARPVAGDPDALDAGTLSAARLNGETLSWLRLTGESPFAVAEAAGATAFDQPCALAFDPRRPRLLLACRAGTTRRQTDALNPRAGAHPGHVVEILGDLGADRQQAKILFLAGDAGEGGQYGRDMPPGSAVPRHPATLAIDARGRAWIGTDRGGRPGAAPDVVFGCDLEGPGRAVPLPIYAAPRGAGIGGAIPTPSGDALLVAVRAPGAEPGASFERPATRWPQFDPRLPPRSALLALSRTAGGPVGG